METLGASLAEHPIFSGLSNPVLANILDSAVFEHFDAGQAIFREGEDANRVYVVLRGEIALEVFRLDPGPITVQILVEGDVLGSSWLIPPYRWRLDARALTPAAAYSIDGVSLRQECERTPRMGYEVVKRIMAVMDMRLQAMRLQLVESYRIAA